MTEHFVDKCLQIYTTRAADAKNCRQLRICRHLKICRTGSVEKKYCRQLSTNCRQLSTNSRRRRRENFGNVCSEIVDKCLQILIPDLKIFAPAAGQIQGISPCIRFKLPKKSRLRRAIPAYFPLHSVVLARRRCDFLGFGSCIIIRGNALI